MYHLHVKYLHIYMCIYIYTHIHLGSQDKTRQHLSVCYQPGRVFMLLNKPPHVEHTDSSYGFPSNCHSKIFTCPFSGEFPKIPKRADLYRIFAEGREDVKIRFIVQPPE